MRLLRLVRDLATARDRVAELEELSDQLLQGRKQLLEAIPECPLHGECIPHALEWIEKAKEAMAKLARLEEEDEQVSQ